MKSGPGGSKSVAMAYEVSRERPTQNTWLAVENSRQTILLPDRVILGMTKLIQQAREGIFRPVTHTDGLFGMSAHGCL